MGFLTCVGLHAFVGFQTGVVLCVIADWCGLVWAFSAVMACRQVCVCVVLQTGVGLQTIVVLQTGVVLQFDVELCGVTDL